MRHRTGRTPAGLLLASLVCASCRPSEHATPDRWEPVPAPFPYPIGEACDRAARRAPPPDAGFGDHVAAPTERCGKQGRVAVVTYQAAAFPPMPASAVERRAAMGKATVLVEGSRVSLDADCAWCRTQVRQLWIGDLALMTDAQIVDFQRLTGLPETPLLTNGAAWEKALAAK